MIIIAALTLGVACEKESMDMDYDSIDAIETIATSKKGEPSTARATVTPIPDPYLITTVGDELLDWYNDRAYQRGAIPYYDNPYAPASIDHITDYYGLTAEVYNSGVVVVVPAGFNPAYPELHYQAFHFWKSGYSWVPAGGGVDKATIVKKVN